LVCSDLAYKKINSQLIAILSRQQAEIEGLLNRLATQLKTKKERLVFQINNYDVILTVLNVSLKKFFLIFWGDFYSGINC